jgi:hypothetical protein
VPLSAHSHASHQPAIRHDVYAAESAPHAHSRGESLYIYIYIYIYIYVRVHALHILLLFRAISCAYRTAVPVRVYSDFFVKSPMCVPRNGSSGIYDWKFMRSCIVCEKECVHRRCLRHAVEDQALAEAYKFAQVTQVRTNRRSEDIRHRASHTSTTGGHPEASPTQRTCALQPPRSWHNFFWGRVFRL